MSKMIEISGLNKNYSGKKVIDGLDLEIDHGELFGFLGPNGAGKTTAIRILTTLTKPSSGMVRINGIDVARESARVKSEFGIVQQHLSLNRDLTISEIWSFMPDCIISPRRCELLVPFHRKFTLFSMAFTILCS
jgi:ABC-2 type transport system ATP-binding protein